MILVVLTRHVQTHRNVFFKPAAGKDAHQLRPQFSLGQEGEDDALDDEAGEVGLGRRRVVFLQSLAEDSEQDFGWFAAFRLDVVGKAAVVHQVAQPATKTKLIR